MRRHRLSISSVLALALCAGLAAPACEEQTADQPGEAAETQATGAAISVQVDTTTDVTGFELTMNRVSCNGEAIEPFTDTQSVQLSDLFISSKVGADGSLHPFADLFVSLETGCYDVISVPVQANGEPSEDCAIAGANGVEIYDGITTEIVLVSQCDGQVEVGAIDVISTLNRPPQLLGVTFGPNKFVAHCDTQTICATFDDPDNDPFELVWTQLSGVPLSGITVLPPSAPNADGSITQCVEVDHAGPGMVQIQVVAYDLMKNPAAPGFIRFEDYYAQNGVPATSNDAQVFPSYGVSSAACPCTPNTEVCDDIDNDCDGTSDEGVAPCVCIPGDQNPCYTGPDGTKDVGLCDGGIQICLPDASGFGACQFETTPVAEIPGNDEDEDCDGVVEGLCPSGTCDAGETFATCPQDCPDTCGNGICGPAESYASCDDDCPDVCGNGICGPAETFLTCLADCPPIEICGDLVCEGFENTFTCPSDCPLPPLLCGNLACDAGESYVTCPSDCPDVCGNGLCGPAETSATCPSDCPIVVFCGNFACDGGESYATCPQDCPDACGNGLCGPAETSATCPQDCAEVCGNAFCGAGESTGNCSIDCPDFCNNGFCGGAESYLTCPQDCPDVCGNGVCGPFESFGSCAVDCADFCGNGTCGGGESHATCPADCPPQPSGCNNNGVCEPGGGEAWFNCPADCGCQDGCLEGNASGEYQAGGPYDVYKVCLAGGGYDYYLCDEALACVDYASGGCTYGGFHP